MSKNEFSTATLPTASRDVHDPRIDGMNRIIRRCVFGGLISVHCIILCIEACSDAPVTDEPAHFVAGLSHWQLHRFELYRVNPPFVRMLASIPAALARRSVDWSGFYESPGARPVFPLSHTYCESRGARLINDIRVARLFCVPIVASGAFCCYLWSKSHFGTYGGLVSTCLWCFSPSILGHGHLITPDAIAAALVIWAAFTFSRWLGSLSTRMAPATGSIIGLALLSKTTLLAMIPFFFLSWLSKNKLSTWPRIVLVFVMAILVLNAGYAFEGTGCKLGEHDFVSMLMSGAPNGNVGNRFEDSVIGQLPIPIPKNYLLGIDVQSRDFERHHLASYVRGNLTNNGWWWYYLYGIGTKTPIGTLLLGIMGLVTALSSRSLEWSQKLVLIGAPAFILALVSYNTGHNNHVRYVLPAHAFMFVIAGSAWSWATTPFRQRFLIFLLVWSVTSSIWIAPHSLSYFNELVGPRNGDAHLIYSNYDWGQDLYNLKTEIESRPEITADNLALAYFGSVNPAKLGIDAQFLFDPRESTAEYHAVSASFSRGMTFPAAGPLGHQIVMGGEEFIFYSRLRPIASAGYSIRLYRVDDTENSEVERSKSSNQSMGTRH